MLIRLLSIATLFALFLIYFSFTAGAQTPVLKVEPGTQPDNTLLPARAIAVPFTVAKLTALEGDVEIRGLAIQNTGVASDSIFSSISISGAPVSYTSGVLRNGIRDTTRQNLSFTLEEGETIDIKISGTMASSLTAYNGEQPSLSLVGITTDAEIEGALPITGATHTVNASLSIGTMLFSRGSDDPNEARDVLIGSHKVFNGQRMSVGTQESITLYLIIWSQTGTVASDDVQNLKTFVRKNGVVSEYDVIGSSTGAGAITLTSGNYLITSFGATGITLDKNENVDIYLAGDVVSGVGRTATYNMALSYGVGNEYGYTIVGISLATGFVHSITTGSLQITSHVGDYQGKPELGALRIFMKGEPLIMDSIEFFIGDTTTQDITLWDGGGKIIAGPVNPESNGRVLFTGEWYIPDKKSTLHVTGSKRGGLTQAVTLTGHGERTGSSYSIVHPL